MQAKLLDFASDKIANSLSKIDKDDVKNVISKFRRQQKASQKDPLNRVNSSEDYCEMIKKEWPVLDAPISQQKHRDESERSSKDEETIVNHCEPTALADIEQMHCPSDPDSIKSGEVQSFIQKKNLAQGMMDLALVSANCNQLRYVLDSREVHPYFFTSLSLIVSSLALQVIVGLVLLYSNRFNLKRKNEMKKADTCSIIGIYGVFLITLTNFLISAFSGSNVVIALKNNETNGPDV